MSKKRIFTFAVLCICMMMLCSCKKDDSKEAEPLTIEIDNESSIFNNIEQTDKEIPEEGIEKLETGIKNWSRSTIGVDDSFTEENKNTINEKFYAIISQKKQREAIQQERDEFYKDAAVETQNIDVSIEKANEAIYNDGTIGDVECTVTIQGTRNGESFENKYKLTMLMDYQYEIASVYEVVSIESVK